jgi:hypothetical protein
MAEVAAGLLAQAVVPVECLLAVPVLTDLAVVAAGPALWPRQRSIGGRLGVGPSLL